MYSASIVKEVTEVFLWEVQVIGPLLSMKT